MAILNRVCNIALVILCCISYTAFSQRGIKLRHVRINDQRDEYGRTIMYGCFVPLGGVSGGIVGIYNIDNHKYYIFNIAMGSKDGSFFRWFLPSGRYIVLRYYWKNRIDDIYKNGRMASVANDHVNALEEIENRYTFYIAPDTVTYVGAWHFENYQVSFTNQKVWQDSTELYKTFRKKLDITQSLINIPK